MKTLHASTLIALVCALAACTDASTDESSTTTSPGETNDEVGSESTSEATDTSSDTTGSESDTTSETGEPEPAVCGDGLVTGAELCDDGNAIDDDGCSNACEPRPCPLTWERIDEPVTLTTTKLDNTPLAELPNGNIVVGNTLDGASGIDIRVQVWTPEGDLAWSVVHEIGALRDSMGDVLADASGDIFVGGGANVGTDGVATVLRLSGADGSIVWTFERDIVGALDNVHALTLDDQGRVLVAIEAGGKDGERDVEVQALDPMTGLSEWKGHWTSEGNHDDWPTSIAFDPSTGQVWVLANALTGSDDAITPTLLSFVPPSQDPVLVTVPIDDGAIDFDKAGSLVFDAQDRLWISLDDVDPDPDTDTISIQLAQIDVADGSVVQLLDSRDLPIAGDAHDSWLQGDLDGLVGGGLALAGWTHSKPDLGIDFYGFVVVLDAEGQNDCMLRLSNDNGYHYPFEPFGASDGAIYVNGHVQKSGDWHSMLLRVR